LAIFNAPTICSWSTNSNNITIIPNCYGIARKFCGIPSINIIAKLGPLWARIEKALFIGRRWREKDVELDNVV
jgi:hypothetical protein